MRRPGRAAPWPKRPRSIEHRCGRSNPRDRARPNPGRSAMGPWDGIALQSWWKLLTCRMTCLLGEFFRKIGRGDQRLHRTEIGAVQELLFGRAGSVEAAPAPGKLDAGKRDAPIAARASAAQAVVFEQP